MGLRIVALALGTVTGFVFGWARLTDPDTFHRMLALRSPAVYLLMAAAVATALVGSRLLRGHRALLTSEPVAWSTTRPSRDHLLGSVVFGVGWAVSAACPGPTAAQLGSGRVLAVAVAAGIVAGVGLQPRLASALERARCAPAPSVIRASDVL